MNIFPKDSRKEDVQAAAGAFLSNQLEKEILDLQTDSVQTKSQVALSQEAIAERFALDGINTHINNKYYEASSAKCTTEENWLLAFQDFRGQYSPDEMAKIAARRDRNPGAAAVFIKVAKTKSEAAYSQILDILFSSTRFPIAVEPTPVPQGVPEFLTVKTQHAPEVVNTAAGDEPEVNVGYDGDGQTIEPGATNQSILDNALARFKGLLSGRKLESGPSNDKSTETQLNPADLAAEKLDKVMQDQLLEDKAEFALRKAMQEMCILGTGIIKGPFNKFETCHKYTQPGGKGTPIQYKPVKEEVPKFKWVSCWNFYPDPDAQSLADASYVIERHPMTSAQLRDLRNFPYFDEQAIAKILKRPPSHIRKEWESQLRDSTIPIDGTKYEVLEYWGWLDAELLEQLGSDKIDLEDSDVILSQVQMNVWVCEGEVIRLVVNPYTPQRIPYYLAPYEEHPYQIWGIGIPENMRDTTRLMNGHMRMAIDNLKLAGNVIFEVNENQLAPGQDMTIYDGKIFRKQGGAPGQSIYGIRIPDVSQSHLAMFDKSRQLTDESTGLPSYSYGQTGIMSTGRTAAGISMLMGAASGAIKNVIRNVDHYMLSPLGQGLFHWNMQFNETNIEIRGDVKVIARGTQSLMQKEVFTQRLMTFLQVTAQPDLRPWVNVGYFIKELAKAFDLNPDKAVNDLDVVKMYQEMQAMQGGQNGQGNSQEAAATNQAGVPASMGSPNGIPQGQAGQGIGGGGIGVGAPSMPGEGTFSGRPQAA